MAEWLGRGLQSLAHQFDSGRRLSLSVSRALSAPGKLEGVGEYSSRLRRQCPASCPAGRSNRTERPAPPCRRPRRWGDEHTVEPSALQRAHRQQYVPRCGCLGSVPYCCRCARWRALGSTVCSSPHLRGRRHGGAGLLPSGSGPARPARGRALTTEARGNAPLRLRAYQEPRAPLTRRERGADQNRTGVRGFAGLCLTTRPRRRGGAHRSEPVLP